jgi:hypothetical protein
VVHAGATGATTTLYFNLYNDGVTGAYAFNKKDAQASVLLIPVT